MTLTTIKLGFWAFFCTFYGMLFAFIFRKYRDCKAYPAKYNEIPNFEEYRNSVWYYNPKKSYGKGTLVQHGIPIIHFLCIGVVMWLLLSISHIIKIIAPADIAVFSHCFSIWQMVIYLCTWPSVFFIADYFLMQSKRPQNICYVQSQLCANKRRSTVFQEHTLFALISVVVILVFRLSTTAEFGYVDDRTLVYMPMFGVTEQVYELDELADVKLTYDFEGNLEHYYITNDKGQSFDIEKSGLCCLIGDEEVDFREYVDAIICDSQAENFA